MSEKELTIYEIPDDTQYWLVRADGGKYYSDFKYSNTISLQDNELTLELFNGPATPSHEVRLEFYKKQIAKAKPDYKKQQVTITAKKMISFINQMKIGDIVVVPSESTKYFLVGVIISDPYELTDEKVEKLRTIGKRLKYDVSENKKRRKVKWLNEVPRGKINSNFLYTLTMHQSIINVTESSDYITPLVSPMYISDNKLTLCIRVNTPRGITSETWQDLYVMINELRNKDIDERIAVKTNVESPGYIILSSSLGQLLGNDPIAFISGLIVLAGILFGGIELGKFKVVKGIVPGIIDTIKDIQEIKMNDLKIEGMEIDLENKKKDQPVADLQREKEFKELTKVIESMDLWLDEPKAPNANGFQMQMDFDDFESEE